MYSVILNHLLYECTGLGDSFSAEFALRHKLKMLSRNKKNLCDTRQHLVHSEGP